MPHLRLPDCELYYEVNGKGPAVIFAHGLGGNHLSWWQQVPWFQDRYTCITFAHRGFGPSHASPQGPGPTAFPDDLAALIDHLSLPDVRLVAQSMGGWTCLRYTLRNQSRVKGLVMAATTGTFDHPEVKRLRAELNSPQARAELQARGIHPAAGERMDREQPALHFLYKEISGLNLSLDTESTRRKLMEMATDGPDALRGLRVPVLCIAGEEDRVIPPESVTLMAGEIPGAKVALVPEAGHSVYFERPETFNRLVDQFLASVDR